MKNILFVLPWLPWPIEYGGGRQAIFNGIASIKGSANIFVTYIENRKNKKDSQQIEFINALGGDITVLPYIEKPDISTPRKFTNKIYKKVERYLFKKDKDFFVESQMAMRDIPQKEIDFIAEIIDKYHIDIVQVEMLSHIKLVNSLPAKVEKIFVHHELGFVRISQVLFEMRSNDYYHNIAEYTKILEIGLLNKYDKVIVLSETDRNKLIKAGVTVPVRSSFAIVKQPDHFNPIIDDYHRLFYIGPSSHKPNYFAVKWFLENCWEKLLKNDSNYKLIIIGRWDDESIKTLHHKYKNVEFAGFVENLATILNNGIMIVPLTIGSGIRMKILEAAANGVPIVSTTIGAEGLPIENGKNGFLADEPDLFVSDILRLQDKTLRTLFVKELNETIRERYSLNALKKNRCMILGIDDSVSC